MKIRYMIVKPNTYGTLGRPFNYFGEILSDHLESCGIESSLEELEITLAQPATNKKSNDETVERYKDWFNQLPYSRFSKKRTAFSITIQLCNSHGKSIPLELDSLFEKTVEVFSVIESKEKKAECFNTERIREAISSLQKDLIHENLDKFNDRYDLYYRDVIIKRNLQDRINRENSTLEATRLIYDIRLYHRFTNLLKVDFTSHFEICKEILAKLRNRKFKLPGYSHIYIQVSDTWENALAQATALESWYRYGLAVLENPTDYPNKPDAQKKRITFELIKTGLTDIAKIDHLDITILSQVLNEVEKEFIT